MDIKALKINPKNPRIIRDAKFQKLKKSIHEFPKMMSLRPIVVDADGMALGGNMRLQALIDLGFQEVPDEWVRRADDLSEEERERFIIADNVGFGEWEWETLANEWDTGKLEDWGLEVPGWESEETGISYADKNKEVDVDGMDSDMKIVLNYTEDEYWQVKEGLSKIAQTPEAAVWKLLGNE